MWQSTKQLYQQAYTGLDRRMWLLAIVMLINRSGTMVLAFMTLYCTHIGFSVAQGGLVVAIYGAGSMLGALLGGKISDQMGFYRTQFATLLGGGLLFILLGQMRTYEGICMVTFCLSMVNEAFRPANATAIAHYSTAANRTQAFSIVRLAINLGWGVGSALGGLLAHYNYHWLFWVDGCTNIMAAILLITLLPKVSVGQQKQVDVQQPLQQGLSPYRDRVFIIFLFFLVMFAMSFFQLFTTVPLFFKDILKLNEQQIGITMALNGVLIALVEMVIVFSLEGKRTYLQLMMYGSGMMAVSYWLLNIGFLAGFVLALLFTLFITIAEMIAMPFMNSYYISRSNQHNRGQYAAIYTMAWSIAQVAGSSSGTWVVGNAGFTVLWWLVGIMSLLALLGFGYLQKRTSISR